MKIYVCICVNLCVNLWYAWILWSTLDCISFLSTSGVELSFLIWPIHLSLVYLPFELQKCCGYVFLSHSVFLCVCFQRTLCHCFSNFQEELKSHTSVQSKWVFNWPSFLRSSPKVFQSLFPPLLEPHCLWTMLKWVIKTIVTLMARSSFSLSLLKNTYSHGGKPWDKAR